MMFSAAYPCRKWAILLAVGLLVACLCARKT